MDESKSVVPVGKIENRILLIRGEKVIIDADLAEFYGVPTKRLNEQVNLSKNSLLWHRCVMCQMYPGIKSLFALAIAFDL